MKKIITLLIVVVLLATMMAGCEKPKIIVLENRFWNSLSSDKTINVYDVSDSSERFALSTASHVVTGAAIKKYNVYLLENYNSFIDAQSALIDIKNDYTKHDYTAKKIEFQGFDGFELTSINDECNVLYRVSNYILIAMGNKENAEEMKSELENIITCENKDECNNENIKVFINNTNQAVTRGEGQ